tara:strand:- start:941 stop:1513 length:573 start_codon:yes stop_codon:yes gene_type:complete
MKRCYACKIQQPRLEFYNDKRSKDGLQGRCKSCLAEYTKNNREHILSYKSDYRAKNNKKIKDNKKEYYRNNKDNEKKRVREWKDNNYDKVMAQNRKRRDNKIVIAEIYSPEDERYTKELFDNKCFNCGSIDNLQIDHNKPLSKGNALTRQNAVLLCRPCNLAKHTTDPEEFYTEEVLNKLNKILKKEITC